MNVKRGKIFARFDQLEARAKSFIEHLDFLTKECDLPDTVDFDWVNRQLESIYRQAFGA